MSVRLNERELKSSWAFLQAQSGIYVRNEAKTLRFLEASLWIVRSGSQWRLLPTTYGRWNSIYRWFVHWQKRGLWQRLFEHLAAKPDWEHVILDSTTVRVLPVR